MDYYLSLVKANYCLDKGNNFKNMKSAKALVIINHNLGFNNIKNIIKLTTKDNRKYKVFGNDYVYQIYNLLNVDKKYSELVMLFKETNLNILEKNIKSKECIEILKIMKEFNKNLKERDKMDIVAEALMNEGPQYEDAYIAGKEDGYSDGKHDGIRKTKIDVAKRLLKNNIDMDIIKIASGLSEKQILALK